MCDTHMHIHACYPIIFSLETPRISAVAPQTAPLLATLSF